MKSIAYITEANAQDSPIVNAAHNFDVKGFPYALIKRIGRTKPPMNKSINAIPKTKTFDQCLPSPRTRYVIKTQL